MARMVCSLFIAILFTCPFSHAADPSLCDGLATNDHAAYWINKISSGHREEVLKWFTATNFYDFNDRKDNKPVPINSLGYHLADRLSAGENHAVLAREKLGFEIVPDKHGRVVLRPPLDVKVLLKNYSLWQNSHGLADDEKIALVFLFVKKSETRPPLDPNDYLVVPTDSVFSDALWPDPEEFKLVSDFKHSAQLPDATFFKFIERRMFPMPSGNYLDHELAHLTEMVAQSNKRPSYIRELVQTREIKPAKRKLHALRAGILLEYFTLPDIQKARDIRSLLKSFEVSERSTLKTVAEKLLKSLNDRPDEEIVRVLREFTAQAMPLVYRQGGGMRDSYNTYDHIGSNHTTVLVESGLITMEEYLSQTDQSIRTGTKESIFGFLRTISEAAEHHFSSPEIFERDAFHAKHNWNPKIDVTTEQYRQMMIHAISNLMARTLIAMRTGLTLKITPAQTLKDGLGDSVDPQSPTAKYLDSFLPQQSFLRQVFEISSP